MTWIVEYCYYNDVEELCKKKFNISGYVDKAAKRICQDILKITDTIDGNTIYDAKRNLIHKVGSDRIEFMLIDRKEAQPA